MLIRLLANRGRAARTILPDLNCCRLITRLYRFFDFWHSGTRYFHRNRVVFGISGSFLHITKPFRHVAKSLRHIAKKLHHRTSAGWHTFGTPVSGSGPFCPEKRGICVTRRESRDFCLSTRDFCLSTRDVCSATRDVCLSTHPVCSATRGICLPTHPVCSATRAVCRQFTPFVHQHAPFAAQ